jgi:hypothetical protein
MSTLTVDDELYRRAIEAAAAQGKTVDALTAHAWCCTDFQHGFVYTARRMTQRREECMSTNSLLYTKDFYEWCLTTAKLVREEKWSELDREFLAEEVESLGIGQKHALGSHLKNLVMHLLKWHYQPSGRQTGYSWRSSIDNARDDIATLIEDSPSLRREVPGLLARRYPAARRLARDETGLPLSTFPETCPWTVEQILDDDFWPEGESLP